MGKNKSFSRRLSANVVLVTSIIFIAAIACAAISSHMLIAEEATKSAENLRDATILDIEKVLQSVERTVESSSWMVGEKKDDRNYLYHITQMIVGQNADIVGSAIAFEPDHFKGEHWFSPYSYNDPGSGELLTKQLGNADYDYFTMEWYTSPLESGEGSWSEPYFDDGGGEFMMSTYSLPVMDAEGHIYAVITADISLEWISGVLDDIKPYKNSYVTLLSREGSFITRGDDSLLAGRTVYSTLSALDRMDEKAKGVSELVDSMMAGGRGVQRYALGSDVSFAVYGPLSNGWVTSITCSYREVLERASKSHLVLILIALLGLLVLFIICYVTIRRMTRPLTDFTESALNIAHGDFNTALPQISQNDEIRRLRDSFEYMQNSLTAYIADLKATTAANERFESELSIARDIQMGLLPKDFPQMPDLSLHAALEPAREVGGDLYDFNVSGDHMYFVVGDVSGKGVPAALFMSITKQAFRLMRGRSLDSDRIMAEVNDVLCDGNDRGMFVTLLLGRFDFRTGEMIFCNAGHNPPVVITPGGEASYMKVKPNLALGVMEGFTYESQRVVLEPGSRLLLYTDGVTEAEKADGSQFGEDALLQWASSAYALEPADACADLIAKVHAWADGNPQNDDITVMTIKYK